MFLGRAEYLDVLSWVCIQSKLQYDDLNQEIDPNASRLNLGRAKYLLLVKSVFEHSLPHA